MKIGILFSVFDGDQKHFDRFAAELQRLALPFAVNFDHCSKETKQLFQQHPNFLAGHENDDPENHFDESHRQTALKLLIKHKFDWALSLDVDETLERRAPEMIQELARKKFYDEQNPKRGKVLADVIDFRVLDLWGDERHYRVDGPFRGSHREKMFNLRSGEWNYYHPTVHAPKLTETKGRTTALVVKGYPCHVLHWGIMDKADAQHHTERWNTIYTRKVGGNPYAAGFYSYINDDGVKIEVAEVPESMRAKLGS